MALRWYTVNTNVISHVISDNLELDIVLGKDLYISAYLNNGRYNLIHLSAPTELRLQKIDELLEVLEWQ